MIAAPRTEHHAAAAAEQPWGGEPGHSDVWPSRAQELLLQAALASDERALDAWRAVRPLIDVAGLDGPTQALLPTLRKNLVAHGVQDELLNLFKGVHRYSWARNQMLLAPMMPVVAALERAGLPTMLLKGAAFVADRRLDAGMRPMNDIDVLVPGEMVAQAIAVLLENGLFPVGGVPPWYVAEYAPRFAPSHGFRDSLDRQLDLHWHVLHASCQEDADEDFWAAARPVELLGVRTRVLSASDELLLVILHGLRWNALPTYRWVIDAALLCSGELGEIDYGRLVEQARRRRVAVALRAGLEYLQRAIGIPVPAQAMRALDTGRPSPLQRLELKAQMTQPRARSALQWQVLYHQQHARREIALGARPTLGAHLRVALARLGIAGVGDLRRLAAIGGAGPGRPDSELAAAVGRGADGLAPAPMGLGEQVDLGDAQLARDRCAHGLWRAEGAGSWIAGTEAKLVLSLAEPAAGSLLLGISADGYFAEGIERQRLEVSVAGGEATRLKLDPGRALRDEGVVLAGHAVGGRRKLELTLRAPDAVSPAGLGVDDDDRRIGIYLRSLSVRSPEPYSFGSELALGVSSQDAGFLAGGWSEAEPSGRWTIGPLAQLLLGVAGGPRPLELEFDAIALLAPTQRRLQCEVLLDGRGVGSVDYVGDSPKPSVRRLTLPATAAAGGEMLLGWQVRDSRSPRALGISDDPRELGLFIRRVVVSS